MNVWLKFALIALGFIATCAVILLTWPVSLFLLLSLTIWGATWNSKRGVNKAAHSAASSWILGFGLLALLLLIFNCIPAAHDISVVGPIETHLIEFNGWIEKHTDLHWYAWLGLFAGMIVIGHFVPEWKLVSRSLHTKAVVEKVAAVMATVASFTFTTSLVANHELQRAHTIIVARYQNAREARKEAAERYLAAESIRRLIPHLDSSTLSDYRNLFIGLNAATHSLWNSQFGNNDLLYSSRYAPPYRDIVSDGYAREDMEERSDSVIVPTQSGSSSTPKSSQPGLHDSLDQQFAKLDREESAAASVSKEADDAENAVKKAFSSALDAERFAVKDWADEYVEEVVRSYAKILSPFVPQFMDELFSEYQDRFIKANAELLKKVFKAKAWQRVSRNATQLVSDLKTRFSSFVAGHADELSKAESQAVADARRAHAGRDLEAANRDLKQAKQMAAEAHSTLEARRPDVPADSAATAAIISASEDATEAANLLRDAEEQFAKREGLAAWKSSLERLISLAGKAAEHDVRLP